MWLKSQNRARPLPGIVADDLTGALDSGVQLAKWGLQPAVLLSGDPMADYPALIVSSDSRQVTADEAYGRANDAASRLAGRALYKKIDSTVRGNVGAEIDGILDARGWMSALIAPAYPASGRTTKDGYHFVHGVPLAQTDFARDPLCPMHESHLPTLLAGQTRRPVGLLALDVIERGVSAVVAALDAHAGQIVVADAITQTHLNTLALALAGAAQPWLPCGSAGLAEEWPAALGYDRPAGEPARWSNDSRPVLVCAGSRHPTTARQLEHARDAGRVTLLEIDPEVRSNDERLSHTAISLLRAGRTVAICSTFTPYAAGRGAAIADMLGQISSTIVRHVAVAGLVLTGGDVARAVCQALGIEAIIIVGEVQPGVPAGWLQGGALPERRVVTKAGGFGNEDAILRSIQYIQGNHE
jgi:D-threonate/D-erythronate kinase